MSFYDNMSKENLIYALNNLNAEIEKLEKLYNKTLIVNKTDKSEIAKNTLQFYKSELGKAKRDKKEIEKALLVKNPSLTACKKLIEREQNKNEKPTISHYRDIENGMDKDTKEKLKYALGKWKKDGDIYYYQVKGSLKTYGLKAGMIKKVNNQYRATLIGVWSENFDTLSEAKQSIEAATYNLAMFPSSNGKAAKNPNPLASVIRDEKLKLARLERDLAKTPRNDYSKRERLQTSIRALKESIDFQSKMFKNPTRAKVAANPSKLPAMMSLRGVAVAYNESGIYDIFYNLLPQYYSDFTRQKMNATGKYYKYFNGLSVAEFKQKFNRGDFGGIENLRFYNMKNFKPTKNPTLKPRKNATHADFRNYEKVALNDLSRMFQGQLTPRELRVLEPDIAPAKKSRLGYLVQMKIKRNGQTIPIDFNGESFLSADLRRNLWATGKDSILDNASIRALGIKKPVQNGLTILGDLTQIDYVTAKKHIENGETVRFFHKLGEASGERPKLAIDYDGFPIILGGAYDVWNVGIVN